MRHRRAGRAFSRTSSHKKAMFANMCNSLIEHELIKTTLPKAKELRRYIEPLITVSKEDKLASRRHVFSILRSRESVSKLFAKLGPRYNKRPGGYVRVLKCGFRYGDNAPMAVIELVDRDITPELVTTNGKEQKQRKPKVEAKTKTKQSAKPKKDLADAKETKKAKSQQDREKVKAKDEVKAQSEKAKN